MLEILEITKSLSASLTFCGIMYLIMGTKGDLSEYKVLLFTLVSGFSVFIVSSTLLGMHQ